MVSILAVAFVAAPSTSKALAAGTRRNRFYAIKPPTI
jgi:hypothetical protein